jgi:YD repeat-containing protein
MRHVRKLLAITILITLGSATAFASLPLQHDKQESKTPSRCQCRREAVLEGSFFTGVTDISYPGGFEPKIERAYNSKGQFRGIFGNKWGGEYEVFLTISADGSVLLHEYGGAANYRFSPEAFSQEELEKAVSDISHAAADAENVVGQKQLDEYRDKLRRDSDFRNEEWEKYKRLNLVPGRELPVGSVLRSVRYDFQYIKRMRDGYLRVSGGGKLEHYNSVGRLTRISDLNNNYVDFSYDADNRLKQVVDNYGRKMTLTFNSRGLVESIEGDQGKSASYRYDDQYNLIYSANKGKPVESESDTSDDSEKAKHKKKEVHTESYQYQYDAHSNLIKVTYDDKSNMQIDYFGDELQGRMKSKKETDGTLTAYKYTIDPKDRTRLKIELSVSYNGSKGVDSHSVYDYYLAFDAEGNEWIKRLVTDFDGEITDADYNHTGNPIHIKRGDEEASFQYDDKGHVLRKETTSEITELRYHPRWDKVEWVQRTDKTAKKSSWAKFNYSDSGNLMHTENSDHESVDLKYDENGRISTMTSKDQSRIEFAYDQNSKPIEIRRVVGDEVQSITVIYAEDGTILETKSTAGGKIAAEVSLALNRLLEVIRPAQISLTL